FLASLARDGDFETITTMVIRMVVIVAVIAGSRKASLWLYETTLRALFPTAYIAVSDPSYLWVMAWMAQDPSAQKQITDFQLSTEEWRQVRKSSASALRRSAETNKGGTVQNSSPSVGEQNASWAEGDIIGQIIPTYRYSIRLRHEGKYLWVKRRMSSFARSRLRTVDHIQIRTLFWQKDVLKRFLVAAHQSYFAKEDRELLIFNANRIVAKWQSPVSRPVRPWSSVILPDNMKEDLITDIGKFLSDKEVQWYAARGIPHRRGYLFHGTPGSGKTTLATAIASKLRLDIYVVNPSQRGMDDAKLSKLFRDCPARSVILIEDIDCIFPRNRGRNNVTLDGSDGEPTSSTTEGFDDIPNEPPVTPMFGGKHDLAPSTVTLSGLLNAIDGVSSQEGCILIASTNHPERLDPALSRAGRFDVHLAFFHASRAQARALFLHFYPLEDF
ncbi:P-loop containing nucleoside triphosphate hydrolase protein, partial [Naematelia encephala]